MKYPPVSLTDFTQPQNVRQGIVSIFLSAGLENICAISSYIFIKNGYNSEAVLARNGGASTFVSERVGATSYEEMTG